MAPNSFLGIGVHEGCLGVHELPRVAHGHVTGQVDVAAPLVGEDQSFGIAVSLNDRDERELRAIGNHLEKALSRLTGDTAEHPALGEHAFIPLRDTGERSGTQAHGQMSEHAVELLTGVTVHLQDLSQIGS